MKTDIRILNVMQWEKDGKRTGKLSFIFPQVEENKNFIGVSDISCFYTLKDGEDFISKFPKDIILQPVKAILLERPSFKDKLAISRIVASIEYNNHVIDLVQSNKR